MPSAAASTCPTGCGPWNHAACDTCPAPNPARARLQLLSQITVISKISAIRVKLCTAAIVKQAQGEDVPYEKLNKLLGDAKLGADDVKAVIAALHFIVTSAAR